MLGDFLRSAQPAWDYRQHDCSRWLDRYLCMLGYASPMEATGIQYDSEREAKVVIGRGGGLLALWTAGLEAIGLEEVETPALGDVAILSVPTDDGEDQTCGIWTGKRWASVHRTGTAFGIGDPLKVWRV
ncbi:hypothetical protein [uncultured Novosphingobium sp.]|uniref:DUF6950 family protein n=1 Tax=uncultured Novosphingobium sp. TaxID=292277 RepID=UPI002598292F|nr:hypothetical protein [uncultured Novosphingobium sp.]